MVRSKKRTNKTKVRIKTTDNLQTETTPTSIETPENEQTLLDFKKNVSTHGLLSTLRLIHQNIEKESPPITLADFDVSSPAGMLLFKKAALKIRTGAHIGLIGANGLGKSTLLFKISQKNFADFPKDCRVYYIGQDDLQDLCHCEETDCLTVLLQENQVQQIFNTTLGQIEAKLSEDDSYSLLLEELYELEEKLNLNNNEKEAIAILEGLGFDKVMRQKKVNELSGGWRKRLSIALGIFSRPDLLLLDEPTNHLDFSSVLWLQNYLQDYKRSFITTSHDRNFIDCIAKEMAEIENLQLKQIPGNYTQFLKIKQNENKFKERRLKALKIQIGELNHFVEKFKDKGTKMQSSIQSKYKELEKLTAERGEIEDTITLSNLEKMKISLTIQETTVQNEFEDNKSIIDCTEVCFSYDENAGEEKILLDSLECSIYSGDKIALVGQNGAGKSTLIKLITNKIKPGSGNVQAAGDMRIKSIPQHHHDVFDQPEWDCIEFLEQRVEESGFKNMDNRYQHVRQILGKFGISQHLQTSKIKTLSGGQKTRLLLCMYFGFGTTDLVILDEPTNHLDLQTIELLIETLVEYQGALLVVSHDQYFVQEVCNKFWLLRNKKIENYDDFTDLKEAALS
eukprot:GAHX01001671.1.p1 GENE.GAHX01001671.1~~GAHX01001671.1.p1  ORF type:complete len:623 (+),score=139.65 GAHX01001671.1:53-1921(+)